MWTLSSRPLNDREFPLGVLKHPTIADDLKQAVRRGGFTNMNDSEFITMIIFVAAMLIYYKITGYSSGLSAFDIMMLLFGIPIIIITTDTILGIYKYRRKKTTKKT